METTSIELLKPDSQFRINFKNKTDGIVLLSDINRCSVAAAFFDPQYRGVLDKLNYGNEGESRGKGRCRLPQMSEELIVQFIKKLIGCCGHLGICFFGLINFIFARG